MTKYCSKCGRLLEKGEKCNCQGAKKHEIKENVKEYTKEFLTIYKTIFTKPIDTVKKYTNKPNMIISSVQVLLFALITGIYSLFIAKSVYVIYGIITKEYFTAIYNANLNSITLNTNIPYFRIFIIAILFIIILTVLTTVAIYLVNSLIFKSKSSIKRVFCLYSINTVILTIALALASLVSLISFQVSVIILLFAFILANIYLFSGIKFISIKDDNKYGYIYIISAIIIFIVFYILFKII